MTDPTLAPRPGANVAEFTVSELSNAIRRALEDGFGHVRLRGEISGFRGPHASGHCYFALKDDKAKIEAVIWRGVFQKLRVKPEEGMEVVAQGRITTFPGSSKYQIVIDALEPAGIGALMAVLEERKRKLAAEGLFDEHGKKKLPFLPRVVGIVTSPTGAVIRDMLHGFAERFPTCVLVWPVRVQGEGSAAEVAAAIRGFNALPPDGRIPRPDVLIVARGGGSLEDLWSFNDEAVVRAAAASAIPLISAVGHETDWTLIDLAADARAPTPTKAAEWAVPKYSDLLQQQAELDKRLHLAMRRTLENARAHLRAAARGIPRLQDLVALPRQRFDAAEKRLGRAILSANRNHARSFERVSVRLQPRLVSERVARIRERLDAFARRKAEALSRVASNRRTRFAGISARVRPDTVHRRISLASERSAALASRSARALTNLIRGFARRLDGQAKLLGTLSHQGVLERGFALVRDGTGRMVRSAATVAAGARLEIEFADGGVPVTAAEAGRATKSRQPKSPPTEPQPVPDATRPARTGRSSGGSGQGSLF